MAIVQIKQQTAELLLQQCERCIECLNNVIAFHLDIDPPDRIIEADGDEYFYRLRKALLHVSAITGWQIKSELLHVIAPEIRCANKQLEKVLMRMPESFPVTALGDKEGLAAEQIRQRGKALREIVSGFVHPTPQRLLLPIERGGFYETREVPSLAFIVWMLMDLTLNYTVSVAFLSTDSKTGIPPELTHANERLESVAAAVRDLSFDEIFRAGE